MSGLLQEMYRTRITDLDPLMSDCCNDDVIQLGPFLPRCMECRRGLAMRILSARLSVYHMREL